MERQLPNSLEAEKALLGCILLDSNTALEACFETIGTDTEAFYDLRHQSIYAQMLKMHEDREPIEVLSLRQKLVDKGILEQVGGISYLAALPDTTPSAANARYYADIVAEKRTLRKLLAFCSEASESVYSAADDIDSLIDRCEREMLAIRQSSAKEGHSIKDVCQQVIDRIESLHQRQGAIGGLSTGLADVDKLTDGMHPGEMIVIAAYPSVGKTAFAMQLAMNNAIKGHNIGVFSCEMRAEALMTRAVCAEARVNLYNVRDGFATQDDFTRLSTALAKFSNLGIHIENSSGWTINQVVARARRMKKKHNIALVVVDYLQLLSSEAGSREQEVSAISKGLKSMAMELNVPVLALSQLNDDGKLRESRSIGQDADSVWKLELDGEREPKIQPIKLNVEKNREGAIGFVPLTFIKTFTRFEQAAKLDDNDMPPTQYKD